MKTVLTIAGSDSSGGAGIQADLKTMIMNGVFGMSAVTALTAQNTIGVSGILAVDGDFLRRQIDAVFEDIRPDAVKIGMAVSKELIQVAAERLLFYRADHVVVDPVMISTSGSRLLQPDAVEELTRRLFPLAQLVTPNIPEAELLSGRTIADRNDMELAAEHIGKAYGCAVLYADGRTEWFAGKRIDTSNTHGTGCTLSSAIASNLAKGFSLRESVKRSKEYLSGALSARMNLGAGSGPVDHGFCLNGYFSESAVLPV